MKKIACPNGHKVDKEKCRCINVLMLNIPGKPGVSTYVCPTCAVLFVDKEELNQILKKVAK